MINRVIKAYLMRAVKKFKFPPMPDPVKCPKCPFNGKYYGTVRDGILHVLAPEGWTEPPLYAWHSGQLTYCEAIPPPPNSVYYEGPYDDK